MKNDLKISILSIACVLCTSMAMPAFGASSVRSLGGAGTYSSASSAASVKSGSASAADKTTGSVRGGSVRVNSTSAKDASGVRASSSRVSATPRLSIGKYLGGSTAVSGGGSNDKVDGELSGGGNGNLQQRIRILEAFMGFSSTGDNIPEQFDAIQVDVEKLKDDLAALSDGQVTDVTYASGVLTVVKGGDEIVYDLADDFAGMSEIAALETALDDLESKLADYAKLSDLDGLLTSVDLSELEDAVAGLTAADVSMNSAIAVLQGGKVSYEDLNSKVDELQSADADLQAAIDALKNTMPSTEGLVNKDYVDNAVAGLESADAALQDAIDAIVRPDVDKAYVDAAIAGLNTAITELRAADTSMGQAIADLQSRMANVATRDDIKDFVTSDYVTDAIKDLATKSDIQDFVKSGDFQAEIAKLATKEQIADFVTSDVVTKSIADATKDLLTADDVADFVTSGDMAAAITNATSDLVTTAELNTAKSELQAAIEGINAGNAELTNYYTKAEIDGKLALKADKSELTPLATTAALESAVTNLTTLINNKQAAGDYLVAADLATLEAAVAALETDKATVADLQALQTAVSNLGETYATDAELSAAVAAVEAKIPTVPTVVSAFTNDAGYITDAALTDYAKTADVTSALASKADASALADAVADLQALIDDKQAAGEYLVAADLKTLEDAVDALDLGKADTSTVAALQSAVDNLGDKYATDSEISAAVAAVEAKIPTVPTVVSAFTNDAGYITDAALTDYAKSADVTSALASKADASALDDLVTSQELTELRTALETEIAKKQAAGEYATAEGLQNVANELGTLKNDVYTKAEIDQKIADAATGGSVDLSGYATTSALDALTALVNGNTTEIQTLKNAGYITAASVTTGTEDGTIAVDGTNVPVYGLGSAAYTASSAYIAGPTPVTGTHFLQATCTASKCSYKLKKYADVIEEIKQDAGIGTI